MVREQVFHTPGHPDDLESLAWVGRRESFCSCGPSGTGKSRFTEALGQTAVEADLAVAWFTIEDLEALVRRHRADESPEPSRRSSART
ncbi:ATP-binding protein [Streptomyces virginiae]|uniref:ATP-binding protein n=1 Tax=Streptomyces virginiae TaxID=1961 RepID=UPI0036864A44